MTTTLAELFKHNLWANQTLLQTCSNLTDEQLDATTPGVSGSIRTLLVHLVAAEGRYIGRLKSEPRPSTSPEGDPFQGIDWLRAAVTKSGEELIALASTVQPGDTVLNENRDGGKDQLSAPLILAQAINHATEHRTQIKVILTTLEVEHPDLDGWGYGWENGLIKPQ